MRRPRRGADARDRTPRDAGRHRRLGGDRGTRGRGAAAGWGHAGRRAVGLRPPLRRVSRFDRNRGTGRPAGRRTGLAGDRRGAQDRGQLLAGGHDAVGLRVPRHAVQPAGIADHGRGLRRGRLRAVPQRSRRRGRPGRRRGAAEHRDAEPGRVRARSASRHRTAGGRGVGTHRAPARGSHHHSRHGRADGEQHRRAVPHPRAGLGGEPARALLPVLRRPSRPLHPPRLRGRPRRAVDDARAGHVADRAVPLPHGLSAVRRGLAEPGRGLRACRVPGCARRRRTAGNRDVRPRAGSAAPRSPARRSRRTGCTSKGVRRSWADRTSAPSGTTATGTRWRCPASCTARATA